MMPVLSSGGVCMKRKITCILACILAIATVIPSMALAASNAAILDKLTLSGVKVYDVALPTKGTKKTEKQINDLLEKIPDKPSGKGNTSYLHELYFSRLNSSKPGDYKSAIVVKEWYKYIDKSKNSFTYTEERSLMDTKAGISCSIDKYDTNTRNGSYYSWIKGKKTGSYNAYGTFTFIMKLTNYKLYPDATVLGEKCMVYSYEKKYSDGTYTYYRFVSRNTKQYLKYITVGPNSITTWIEFEYKFLDMADSFFDPPKDVKFTTKKPELFSKKAQQ